MARLEGRLGRDSLFNAIRGIHRHRLTGTLRIERESRTQCFYFKDGELYVTAGAAVAGPVRAALASSGSDAPQIRQLLRKMAETIDGWREGTFVFEGQRLVADLVGPLPAALLIAAGRSLKAEEGALLKSLGGREARWAAAEGPDLLRLGGLAPRDAFLLSRLEHPTTLRDFLAQAGMPRRQALTTLRRLADAGAIERHEAVAQAAAGEELVSREILGRFLARIEESLVRTPLGLEEGAHRQRLRELYELLGRADHYELLGVHPAAPAEEIHGAYTEVARLAHPRHSRLLGLEAREVALELLFAQASEAYLVLSDAARRRRYDDAMGVTATRDRASGGAGNGSPVTPPGRRGEEKRRLAREHFDAAREVIAREDYHAAIQLLQQAVAADPQPEYYLVLARCQARNPNWVPAAMRSYVEAARARPADLKVQLELADLARRWGDLARAREAYEGVLALAPEHPDAREGLSRLRSQARERTLERAGFWRKLFSRRAH